MDLVLDGAALEDAGNSCCLYELLQAAALWMGQWL
jgi:hypothetical protein